MIIILKLLVWNYSFTVCKIRYSRIGRIISSKSALSHSSTAWCFLKSDLEQCSKEVLKRKLHGNRGSESKRNLTKTWVEQYSSQSISSQPPPVCSISELLSPYLGTGAPASSVFYKGAAPIVFTSRWYLHMEDPMVLPYTILKLSFSLLSIFFSLCLFLSLNFS